MKNKKIIYIIAIIIIVSLLLGLYLLKKERNINLEISASEKCDRRVKLYYSDKQSKIYTYCLDGIKVIEEDESIELKDYFTQKNTTIGKLFDTLTSIKSLWEPNGAQVSDGGSKLYLNKNYNLLRCHSIKGDKQFNNDIYIGPKEMGFNNNYCKDDNTTYIKTYKVLKIAQGANEFDYLLTLENSKGETDTILYKDVIDDIKENKTYEFEFMLYEDNLEDNMKSIFDNSLIISVLETDKLGIDQINDSIK